MINTYPTIFKRTNSGKVQIWYAEVEGSKFRTVSGQQDGKHVVSEWTTCEPKNVGRSNATTAEEQAVAEVKAMYSKRLEREYRESISDIDTKHYIKPMKCIKWFEDAKKRPSEQTKKYIQPKYDGMRCITNSEGSKSQDGKLIPGAPHFIEGLKEVFEEFPDLYIDGEAYNHEYKADFEGLMSLLKKEPESEEDLARVKQFVKLYIYDLVLPYDYEDRLERIQYIFDNYLKDSPHFVMVESYEAYSNEEVDRIVDTFLDQEYEGGIVRVARDGGYQQKRCNTIFKYKLFQDEEFEVVDIQEGKGNWAGHAKRVVVKLPNGNTCEAGMKGSKEFAKKFLEEKHLHIGKMATIQYFRYTNKGMLYLPVFKAMRWDV